MVRHRVGHRRAQAVTAPPRPNAPLQRVVSRARHLLLDFDGPICSVFAGMSDDTVAKKLRHRLAAVGVAIPAEVRSISDPLEVFRAVAARGRNVGQRAQRELTLLEVQAVRTAQPADGAAELITAARQSGRSVTIVSNNSGQAVAAYLADHRLAPYVSAVIGRDDPNPVHMKPSPYRVRQAVQILQAVSEECVLVGDSVSDITAAHAADVAAIGYANKPGKHQRLAQAGADAVVTRLADLIEAITAEAVRT
jgi:phosphoglycolate phosphatase-like HAD superfamily hydrolase